MFTARPYSLLFAMALFALCCGGCTSRSAPTAAVVQNAPPPTPSVTLYNPGSANWAEIANPGSVEILQVYDLSQNRDRITDDDLRNIRRFPRLRTLVISGKLITDETIDHITWLPELEAVIFYECGFTNDGVQPLCELPNLRAIGFYQSGVTASGADELRGQLPAVHIEVFHHNTGGKLLDGSGCFTSQFTRDYLDR